MNPLDEEIECDFKKYWGIEQTKIPIRVIIDAQRWGLKIEKLPMDVQEQIKMAVAKSQGNV